MVHIIFLGIQESKKYLKQSLTYTALRVNFGMYKITEISWVINSKLRFEIIETISNPVRFCGFEIVILNNSEIAHFNFGKSVQFLKAKVFGNVVLETAKYTKIDFT